MAMTFSSTGCRQAATDLTTSAKKLDTYLNTDFNNTINQVKGVYKSESADELYKAFDAMKAKFPEFIQCINDCSNYLNNTVAPAYEKIESTASSKISL